MTWIRIIQGLVLCIAVQGCNDDAIGPDPVGPDQLYRRLALDHYAVTLGMTPPYNTVKLTAIPLNGLGEVIYEDASPRFVVVGNDQSIDVTDDGVITALAPKSGIRIEVSLTVGNITHKDSVVVNVNNPAVIPQQFDSVNVSLKQGVTTVDCSMTDPFLYVAAQRMSASGRVFSSGNAVSGAIVALSSSDESLFAIDRYSGAVNISCLKTGLVWVRGAASVYGATLQDSVLVSVVPSQFETVGFNRLYRTGETTLYWNPSPALVTIGAGGIVVFANILEGRTADDSVGVIFDDPTSVIDAGTVPLNGVGASVPSSGDGNIDAWAAGSNTECNELVGVPRILCLVRVAASGYRARRFPVPGVYHFRTTGTGTTGTILVKESEAP